MIRFNGGVFEDIETENGFKKRVWLPHADAKNKRAGIPVSLDFEDLSNRYKIPEGQRVQRLLWEHLFISKEDWFRAGIHDALVQGLMAVGYGNKQDCKVLTDTLVREVRDSLLAQ